MTVISESEFSRLCAGIAEDREKIVKHNPIGSEHETLLWMLMSVLVSYLSLGEKEIPCFPGDVDENTYRKAVEMIVMNKQDKHFDPKPYIEDMLK